MYYCFIKIIKPLQREAKNETEKKEDREGERTYI
jgi:hypothetical protein